MSLAAEPSPLAKKLSPYLQGGSGDRGGKEDCFIATACYGTPHHADICVLQNFRDRVLIPNTFGKLFVRAYLRISPFFANRIRKSAWLKSATLYCLVSPAVKVARRYILKHP